MWCGVVCCFNVVFNVVYVLSLNLRRAFRYTQATILRAAGLHARWGVHPDDFFS